VQRAAPYRTPHTSSSDVGYGTYRPRHGCALERILAWIEGLCGKRGSSLCSSDLEGSVRSSGEARESRSNSRCGLSLGGSNGCCTRARLCQKAKTGCSSLLCFGLTSKRGLGTKSANNGTPDLFQHGALFAFAVLGFGGRRRRTLFGPSLKGSRFLSRSSNLDGIKRPLLALAL
jgi:hypothetical protein